MSRNYIPPHMIPDKDKRQDTGWQPEPLYDRVPRPDWDPRTGNPGRQPEPQPRNRGVWITDISGNDVTADTEQPPARRTPQNGEYRYDF